MALPDAPAQISHSMIMAEFGHPTGTEWKLSSNGAAYINFTVGSIIKESNFYGASAQELEVIDNSSLPLRVGWRQDNPSISSFQPMVDRTGQPQGVAVPGDGSAGRTLVLQTHINAQNSPLARITELQVQFNTSATRITMIPTANQNYEGTTGSVGFEAGGENPDYSYNQQETWFTQSAPANATSFFVSYYKSNGAAIGSHDAGGQFAPISAYGIQSGLTTSDTRGSGIQVGIGNSPHTALAQRNRPLETPGEGLVTVIYYFESSAGTPAPGWTSGFTGYPSSGDAFVQRHTSEGGSTTQGQYYAVGTPTSNNSIIQYSHTLINSQQNGGMHIAWFPAA